MAPRMWDRECGMMLYNVPAVVWPAADVDVHHVALEGAVGDELLVALVALVPHIAVRFHVVIHVPSVSEDTITELAGPPSLEVKRLLM